MKNEMRSNIDENERKFRGDKIWSIEILKCFEKEKFAVEMVDVIIQVIDKCSLHYRFQAHDDFILMNMN